MLNFTSSITESHTYNNFSMKEKTPVAKINLRGDLENKDFVSKVGKILGMILPKEACTISTKEQITCMWLGPNEWLLVSNDTVDKESNDYELEQLLFNDISKTNLGAVIDVTDQFVQFELKGKNIYEIFSAGSPFNFNEFKEKKGSTTQTVLNHVDVILHHKDENIVNLFVRRSFAEHLWSWIEDCSSRL